MNESVIHYTNFILLALTQCGNNQLLAFDTITVELFKWYFKNRFLPKINTPYLHYNDQSVNYV
jgi:hypothetical protein